MGLSLPIDDIENPWILMMMFLVAVVFPVWFLATLAFAYKLIRGKPLALQMAVVAYFIVASTSNSFGRKDSTYLLMVGAVDLRSSIVDRSGNAECCWKLWAIHWVGVKANAC